LHLPAYGLDAVLEADQTGAIAEVGSADPVTEGDELACEQL
jgi:hypothetical protein